MGDLKSLINMIPGMSKLTKGLDIDDSAFSKVESIIFSMTPYERGHPEVINMSRKQRIAKGCSNMDDSCGFSASWAEDNWDFAA